MAKVAVTNCSRPLARWEKVIIWSSRAYAWAVMRVNGGTTKNWELPTHHSHRLPSLLALFVHGTEPEYCIEK